VKGESALITRDTPGYPNPSSWTKKKRERNRSCRFIGVGSFDKEPSLSERKEQMITDEKGGPFYVEKSGKLYYR